MIYRHLHNDPEYGLSEARKLVRQAYEGAAELRRDCDMLPTIDADGGSDCPFAEDLFYQKEKTAQFVRDDLRLLKGFLQSAGGHLETCKAKLADLERQRADLHHQSPQDCILRAETELRTQMRRHEQARRDLLEVIAEVEATLGESDACRFPGREPRGPFGRTIRREPPKPRPIEEFRRNNAENEIKRVRRIAARADDPTNDKKPHANARRGQD